MSQSNPRGRFIMATLLALILPVFAACASPDPQADLPASPPATAAPEPRQAPAAIAAARGSGAPGDVLRIQNWFFPETLDPQDSSVANQISVEVLNYEGLTRFNKDLRTVPGAAEKWEINRDATEFTFHLREGLTYSDGTPLTSRDFAAAIKRSLDPRGIVGGYQWTFFMIEGAEAIINTAVPTDEAKLPALFAGLGIKTPDDQTITFSLTQPTPHFPTLVAIWVAYPVKDDLVHNGGEAWWQDPANQIGNGPFQIVRIDRDSQLIELTANQHYWQGRPKLDRVLIRYIDDPDVALQAYKDGEVDIMHPDPDDIPAILADPVLNQEYEEYAGSCTTILAFNLNKPPFDNRKVREAFAYAFDRETYIRDIRKGDHAKTLTWIPPGYPGHDTEQRYDFDPVKAQQALAAAGYPGGKGLPAVKLAYSSYTPANRSRAEYLAQIFNKHLGITIALEPVEGRKLNIFRQRNATYPQMLNGEGWCADYPDQHGWLSTYWHSRSEFSKLFGYRNEQADSLMDQADAEIDVGKRAQLYDQAQKLIIADVPVVIWGNTKNTYLIKPYVKGLDLTPQDPVFPGQQTSLLNVTIAR